MKTSLKNRPDFIHLTGEGVILETCLAKADEWFEEFEAELRAIQKEWKRIFGSDAYIPINVILGEDM